MFWRFGGYASISTIDSILDKQDVTLEEILDESDLIQELKSHNAKLVEYLREEDVLRRLFEYVVAPPIEVPEDDDQDEDGEKRPEPRKSFSPIRSLSLGRSKDPKTVRQEEREELEKQEKARQKYAYAACEILSAEEWSIMETALEHKEHFRKFWDFLKREPPIDPVTAGYFSKVVESFIDKKTAETLGFVKEYDDFVPSILRHIDTPNLMDVLLKMISMEKADGGAGIVEWLYERNFMPTLLSFVGPQNPTFTQTSAGDFIKAIVTISANASQNEQQCIGPNSLTRELVSEPCMGQLIGDMLTGGNPLTVGVGIVIEVIRKNNSDYDPEIGRDPNTPPSSGDPIYLGALLRLFAKHIQDFRGLLTNARYKMVVTEVEGSATYGGKILKAAFGKTIEPLGFDRFKTCELMAELLHCSNMGLLNEKGSEAYVRQRDIEREKLRADGTLSKTRSASSNREEGDPNVSRQLQSDDSRKLEVTNSTDEDGFEELGTPVDLGNEAEATEVKDQHSGFDEEQSSGAQSIKRSTSRVSLDDEFFDEPLTPPKVLVTPSDDTIRGSAAAGVDQIVTSSAQHSTSDKSGPNSGSGAHLSQTTSEQLVDAIASQLGPGSLQAVPSISEDGQVEIGQVGRGQHRDVSPHPEDKPAPLFVKKTESGPGETAADAEADNGVPGEGHPTAFQDSAQLQENGLGSEHAVVPVVEADEDGEPLVGDYLKMMFVEHQVIPTILEFFFHFPWNNFLHNVVYDVVQQVFNGPMDRGYNRSLAIDLFQTGRITDCIIEGQLRSDEAQAQNSMRLGYMGHLTLIAEEVVKFSERHPPEILSDAVVDKMSSRIWNDYVDNTLAETRDRDNAILGGVRPDGTGGPRNAGMQAASADDNNGGGNIALANAGLTGNANSFDGGSNTSNPASGSSHLSAFGNSSDEEEEEMEEIGDGGQGHARSSEQYINYTPSSLSALSTFSSQTAQASDREVTKEESSDASQLPPPLNIPPSRARRQLAARLARHANPSAGSDSPTSPTQGPTNLPGDASTTLSAAFSSIPLNEADHDGADPWSPVQKPENEHSNSNNNVSDSFTEHDNEDSSDWLASVQRHSKPSGSSSARHGDWVDFDDDEDDETLSRDVGEGEDGDDDEDGEGEDVPIRLSMGQTRGLERTYNADRRRDRPGSDSSGSSSSSLNSDEDEVRTKEVKEAAVRSAIDDDDD